MPGQMQRSAAPTRLNGRARALLILLGIGGVLGLVAAVLIASLPGLFSTNERAWPTAEADPSVPAGASRTDGDAQVEAELSQRPMLGLPADATSPRALSPLSAGPPITLPESTQVAGSGVATGFPPTPEGALAQLAALMTTGMAGGDPQAWASAYDSLAEDDAAPSEQTFTGRDLIALRRETSMSPNGPLRPGMTISWTPTSAMVKGTTVDGSFTVPCVLGEFVVDYDGRVVNAGWGNCLPMRLVGGQWRIAAGPTAALAPSAWPGSAEAVAAGWREIRR